MSIVVAIKKNDKVYLGADTQTTRNDNKKNYLNEESRKLILLDNGIILRAVGPKMGGKLIFAHPEFFELPDDGELTKKYISQVILPKINECLEANNMIETEKSSPPRWKNAFIIAYKDKLFWLNGRGSVTVINHFVSIGAGESVVYPGLMKLDKTEVKSDDEINKAITEILRISADRKTSISAPFYLINTESKEFTLER